jgi:type II secretory pathway component PulF
LIFYATQPKYNIVNALQYCQEKKKDNVRIALCTVILHLMCKATNGFILSDVMRDFKKIHSKNYSDYRRTRESQGWLLAYFEKACAHLKESKKASMLANSHFQAQVARRLSR